MSEQQPSPVPNGINLKTLCMVVYGLFALGYLTSGVLGLATIASVIIIYVKRADVAGTIYATHFDWLMSTFLWSLLWLAISFLLTFIFVGWIGVLATAIWVLYRLITGFLALLDGRAIGA